MPLGTRVTVRVIPEFGHSSNDPPNVVDFISEPLSGTEAASAAVASVTLPTSGRGAIIALIDMVSPIVSGQKIRIQTGADGRTQYFPILED